MGRLARIAQSDREEFFRRYPGWSKRYSGRLLCVALCQGAALHFVDGSNGVKDFDVWSFFREIPGQPIRRRRVVTRDFGSRKFGILPGKRGRKRDFIGRPVDLVFRSIPCRRGVGAIAALQQYLADGRTKSARCLAEKAVVLIEPSELKAKVAWLTCAITNDPPVAGSASLTPRSRKGGMLQRWFRVIAASRGG